ncbi:MAG: hypothetical protein ACE5KX_07660, partial [Acidimicrobiia bacterium]
TRLVDETRLLTLTGAGGAGKTRLALQLGAELLDTFPDGVWLADLAGLSDRELVPRAVASALRLAEKPGRTWGDVVAGFLQDKRLLLIVDNCEHLIEAAASLTGTLLRSCPDLRVVATSREPLGLPGEITWRAPPLSLPKDDEAIDPGALTQWEAVRLFAERAEAAQPGFRLTEENREAVVQVCRRLDGMPLGLELAAARVRVLSVPDMASRLDDRFRLFAGGSGTGSARQQTLEAAVAWSYDLLSPPEQHLFDRLSVFAGGFTLEAAERVGAGDSVEPAEVLDLLAGLVNKSLVVSERRNGSTRFRMLETIRAYGRQRLAAAAVPVRDAHLGWALDLAGEAASKLDGPEQQEWLDRVEADLDNFRAALGWAIAGGNVTSGLAIAARLYRYWYMRGVREGREWLDRLLATAPEAPTEVMAPALYAHGSLLQAQGEYQAAADRLGRSLELYREAGNRRGAAYALHYLLRARWGRIDRGPLRGMIDESLGEFRELGDPAGTALSLLFVVLWEAEYGEFDRAVEVSRDLDELCRSIGAPQLVAHGAEVTGVVRGLTGDDEGARRYFAEALRLYGRLRNQQCASHCIENTAYWAVGDERAERVTVLLGAAEAMRDDIGVPVPPYENLYFQQAYERARAALDPSTFAAAWERGSAMSFDEGLETALAVTAS